MRQDRWKQFELDEELYRIMAAVQEGEITPLEGVGFTKHFLQKPRIIEDGGAFIRSPYDFTNLN